MKQIRPCFFGAALTRIRKRLSISRYEVAKRAGLSEEYLYKLEKSFREPRAGMIVRLGRALGIPPGELLNEMDRLMHETEVESASRKEE
ncbi:MAG: helix-turn-helix domain-containing protein [Desulfovibrionaceae bacterium]|nr:helix-turn-helix domain-containing protein [Desulfovibrionaceae bacterium]